MYLSVSTTPPQSRGCIGIDTGYLLKKNQKKSGLRVEDFDSFSDV